MTMTLTAPTTSHRFQQISSVLAVLALIAAIALPLKAAGLWLLWHENVSFTVTGESLYGEGDPPSIRLRLIGLVAFVLVALVQAWGFLGLRTTFQEVAEDRVFSERSVQGFRLFAYTLLFAVFAESLTDAVFDAVRGFNSLQGASGSFSIDVSWPSLTEVFTSLLLVFVAHAFVVGERLQNEQDAIL